MTPETVIDVMRRALEMGMMTAGPTILFALVAGVAVSIFQATTQVNDFNLVFVPKILAVLLALVLFGSWMLQMYVDYTREMFLNLPTLVG
ncbi:MAG: flagellar biosynthesis protein FliQ [Deltaproteobacteria bacterium]|nr:flagellar biosynthesis protein FliQ [Deltaproteobacteria bacterium]